MDDQSVVIGFIYMDNYEEALDSVEDVRRSLLTALIDRKVNKYISSIDGICSKIEKDKYLIILRKKSLRQLQEAHFELLSDVKTVNIGNDMSSRATRLTLRSEEAEIRRSSRCPTTSFTTAARPSRSKRAPVSRQESRRRR